MHTSFFEEYPELEEIFKMKCAERRDEILNDLKNNDEIYSNLIKRKTAQSMVVRNMFANDISEFEKYMDLIYELEVYELNAVYSSAFNDALLALKSLKILP